MKIQSKAMLAQVNKSLPPQTREDADITAEVLNEHNATADAGSWKNKLWPADALKPAVRAQEAVRALVKKNGMPWADGVYVIPAQRYMPLVDALRHCIADADAEADAVAAKFDDLMTLNHSRRNGLFDPDDYPADQREFRSHFKVRVQFFPIPDAEHIFVELEAGLLDQFRDDVVNDTKENLLCGIREPIARLTKSIRRMRDTLKDCKKTFRDTLVENIRDETGLIRELNLLNDPHINQLCEEVEASLVSDGQEPDALRQDEGLRNATATKAADILNRMNDFLPTD